MTTTGGSFDVGAVFPDYALVASDDRVVTQDDFDGRPKLYFMCGDPADDDVAAEVARVARAALDVADVVLIPLAKTSPAAWRYFLRAHQIEGIAPLAIADDVAVPFLADQQTKQLWPQWVFVAEDDEVLAVAVAKGNDGKDLDVAAVVSAGRRRPPTTA